MLASIVESNPVVAGIAAVAAAGVLLLLVAALISGRRGRRRRSGPRQEPAFDRIDDIADGRLDAPYPSALVPQRTGFGFAAVTLAFLLGLFAGLAAMSVGRSEIAAALASLAARIEAPDTVAASGGVAGNGNGTGPAAPNTATAMAPAAVPLSAEVSERLAAFAGNLQTGLPRAVGSELSLNRVAVDGAILHLDYGVGRVIPADEAASFSDYIDRSVHSLFCAQEAREIRYLNDNGVVFRMTYADPAGAIVKDVTVAPDYCA